MSPKFCLQIVVVMGMLAAISGCKSIEPVKPWEKGILSRPEMTFNTDSQDAAYTDHIYFSKEAASGGAGVGGGGCGCN
jgi:hypothetical protein